MKKFMAFACNTNILTDFEMSLKLFKALYLSACKQCQDEHNGSPDPCMGQVPVLPQMLALFAGSKGSRPLPSPSLPSPDIENECGGSGQGKLESGGVK